MTNGTATMTNLNVKTIDDLGDLSGQRVLVRVDFNVPLHDGMITDATRIEKALPTIQALLAKGARVILASHLGRPKGEVNPKFSLKPVAEEVSKQLGKPVKLMDAVYSDSVVKAVEALENGAVLMLENTRFEAGEEKNDDALAKNLASLCDVYVNDAFGAAHRAHASTEGVAKFADTSVAGLLMAAEIKALGAVVTKPDSPFTAIIGGSKVSSKITVLSSLLEKVNTLIIGGAMIFTFLKAQGTSVGNSMVEDDYLDTAKALLKEAETKNVTVLLAKDVVVANDFKADAEFKTVTVDAIEDGWMGLDVGTVTIAEITETLKKSKTVLWNGPLGVFEFENFAKGTRSVADTLAQLSEQGQCKSILGGGDTVAAIEQFNINPEHYTHVSTGGGASLEFLEGKILPGIAALDVK